MGNGGGENPNTGCPSGVLGSSGQLVSGHVGARKEEEESLRTMLLLLISKFILSDYKTEQGIQVESPVAPLFPLGGPALHTAALTFLTLGNKSPENITPIGPSFPIQLAIRLKSHHTYQSRKCINPCPVLQIENDGSYRDLQYTRKQSECKYIQDKRKYRWNKMKPLDLLSWKQLTEKKNQDLKLTLM